MLNTATIKTRYKEKKRWKNEVVVEVAWYIMYWSQTTKLFYDGCGYYLDG